MNFQIVVIIIEESVGLLNFLYPGILCVKLCGKWNIVSVGDVKNVKSW